MKSGTLPILVYVKVTSSVTNQLLARIVPRLSSVIKKWVVPHNVGFDTGCKWVEEVVINLEIFVSV